MQLLTVQFHSKCMQLPYHPFREDKDHLWKTVSFLPFCKLPGQTSKPEGSNSRLAYQASEARSLANVPGVVGGARAGAWEAQPLPRCCGVARVT